MLKKGFTLVELLVVISIIALLLSVLMPSLQRAREQGKAVVCRNNVRQLVIANTGYAAENNSCLVLGAPDIYTTNLIRWHGIRTDKDSQFDSTKSPLYSYLADGKVKVCPHRVNFKKGDPWDYNFEDGCGGYGYNNAYLGSKTAQSFSSAIKAVNVKITEVAQPTQTLMFADCAMAKADKGSPYYIEYSFAEPPLNGWGYSWPSIHFRHLKKANVAWVDGHTSSEAMTDFNIVIYDRLNSKDMMLGWFAKIDNKLFDLK